MKVSDLAFVEKQRQEHTPPDSTCHQAYIDADTYLSILYRRTGFIGEPIMPETALITLGMEDGKMVRKSFTLLHYIDAREIEGVSDWSIEQLMEYIRKNGTTV